MAKLWVPQRTHPEEPKHQPLAELECPKCQRVIGSYNQHGWVICWSDTLPREGCGWFLRIYPGPFGKLMADAVISVTAEWAPLEGDPRLIVKAMRMVTEYWVSHGIMQMRHSQDETSVRMTGYPDWHTFNVERERKDAEDRGLPTDGIR